MVEVPEHLLERARARRAALGLGGDAPAPAADSGAPSAAPATTGAATPAIPTATAAVPAVAAPPPPPPPEYVQAAVDRKKIPWWAMPVVGLLPLWAVLYAGSLSNAASTEPSPLEQGGEIYAQTCAGCHGATGGGGVGPQLSDGALLANWPERADQLRWVYGGSDGWPADTYGVQNSPKNGGMPNFGSSFTPEELELVVRYEREVLSGEEISEETGAVLQIDTDELEIITPEGETVPALTYYFGEAAEAGEYEIVGDEVVITGAEFSADAPGE